MKQLRISKYIYFAWRIEVCINYILLAFSGLLGYILLKQIRITPIQTACQIFLL